MGRLGHAAARLVTVALLVCVAGCGDSSSKAEPARRLLVVGWDGATFDLLDPLMAAGRLPHLRALRERGSEAWLESTIVPISSAAWAAASTGKNPGGTGVYSFFEPVPDSYDVRLIDSRSNRATPIWRSLSRRGLRSIVWGTPVTYPPEPIDGLLVAGMLAPFEADYAHPPGTAQRLRATGFVPDLGMWRSQAPIRDPAAIEQQLAIKERELLAALEAVDWSLAWICFKSLDVLSHAAFDLNPNGPVAALCERLDRSLGALIEAVGPDVNVLVVSDHGFRTYPRAFHVYAWLLERGWAVPSGQQGGAAGGPLAEAGERAHKGFVQQLDLDRTRLLPTKAEGHFGGLRANVVGREPRGTVRPDELESFLSEVRLALLALRGPEGLPVVTAVHRARELYPGPHADLLPDLLFETEPSFVVFGERAGPILSQLGKPYPDHDRRGVFVAAGPDVRARDGRLEFAIADVAPTALALLGLPLYDDLDGRARQELFTAAVPVPAVVSEADDPPDSAAVLRFLSADETLSSAEHEELMGRMKELGYVE